MYGTVLRSIHLLLLFFYRNHGNFEACGTDTVPVVPSTVSDRNKSCIYIRLRAFLRVNLHHVHGAE